MWLRACRCTSGLQRAALQTPIEVHAQVHLQLTFVRDQANNPHAASFLGSALVFPSPASVALSPTPDNEERGPVVKSYLKQSSELRLCANRSSVTQRVIGVLLPATRTNASNNRAASNARRLSSGAVRTVLLCAQRCTDLPEQRRQHAAPCSASEQCCCFQKEPRPRMN